MIDKGLFNQYLDVHDEWITGKAVLSEAVKIASQYNKEICIIGAQMEVWTEAYLSIFKTYNSIRLVSVKNTLHLCSHDIQNKLVLMGRESYFE